MAACSSTTSPTFAVKVRPSDLPNTQRDEVVARLAALLGTEPPRSTARSTANPGSAFDLVRVAQDVDQATAQLISERRHELPGVEVVVEARRQYTDGPLMSQLLGYTGPVDGRSSSPDLRATRATCRTTCWARSGVEAQYETELRGTYGSESVERDATGRRTQVLQTDPGRRAGRVAHADDRHEGAEERREGPKWAMKKVGIKRGVVIAMNPQTGEVLAMVSLPTYDNNLFARGISNKDFAKLLKNKDKPLLNHAVQAHYAAGVDVQARDGHRSAGGREDHRHDADPDLRLPDPGLHDGSTSGTTVAGACATSTAASGTRRTRSSTSSRACSGIDRLGYWAQAVRLRGADRASTCRARSKASSRPTPGSMDALGAADLPGRDLPGRASGRATTP